MEIFTRKTRQFVADDFVLNNWQDIESYYTELSNRQLLNTDDILTWLSDRSETDSIIDEEYRWRYIRQTCDTENEQYKHEYEDFIQHVMPNWMLLTNDLNKKLANNPHTEHLDQKRFFIYLRGLKKQIEIFREENIPLTQQIQLLSQEYGAIIGAMTIEHAGQEYTMPQASVLLQNQDRVLRKEIFDKIAERRLRDKHKLNNLFDELLKLRHQIALNAGYKNFRDYMFDALGRFDYGVKESEQFHQAILEEVTPMLNSFYDERKHALDIPSLQPYDLEVDIHNEPPLKPFETEEELIQKSVQCLQETDGYFAECIEVMNNMKHLDLESRKGKAPGGYNMTLPELGVPFIFMNAAGTQSDVETIVHEAGHAVHSFLTRDLPYNFDQEITSENAELASMSMELMSFDGLSYFYDEHNKKRAIRNHLKRIIGIMPWIALVDKFQHWIYLHPEHTAEERETKWQEMHSQFYGNVLDWKDYNELQKIFWHKQLHIFEVPFYYIEYGIAQLGAIGVWRNYKQDKQKAIQQYKEALALGYTKTLPEIYRTAGVSFHFDRAYVKELMQFIMDEISKV